MSTRQEMIERRHDVSRLYVMGMTPWQIAAFKKISAKTIYRDLEATRDERERIMGQETALKILAEIRLRFGTVNAALWKKYAESDLRAQPFILSLISQNIEREGNMCARMGFGAPAVQVNSQVNQIRNDYKFTVDLKHVEGKDGEGDDLGADKKADARVPAPAGQERD